MQGPRAAVRRRDGACRSRSARPSSRWCARCTAPRVRPGFPVPPTPRWSSKAPAGLRPLAARASLSPRRECATGTSCRSYRRRRAEFSVLSSEFWVASQTSLRSARWKRPSLLQNPGLPRESTRRDHRPRGRGRYKIANIFVAQASPPAMDFCGEVGTSSFWRMLQEAQFLVLWFHRSPGNKVCDGN